MPSRFAFFSTPEYISERYGLKTDGIDFYEYYNLKPTNRTTGLVWDEGLKLARMRWGFVGGKKFFKARAETASEKKLFSKALNERRCLIFANGFFEWNKDDEKSTPYYFSLKGVELFCIAGLYNSYIDEDDGKTKYTTAVLTVEANELVGEIFHRMPAIIEKEDEKTWLNPITDLKTLQSLLKPFPANRMQKWEVDPLPARGDNGPKTIEKVKNTSLDDFF